MLLVRLSDRLLGLSQALSPNSPLIYSSERATLRSVSVGRAAREVRAMGMGRRRARQESLFTSTADLARSPGHLVYRRLNQLLGEAGFDRWIE